MADGTKIEWARHPVTGKGATWNAPRMPTRTEQVACWYVPEWTGGPRWEFGKITVRESVEMHRDDEPDLYRFGKLGTGRLLDGQPHDAMPEVG